MVVAPDRWIIKGGFALDLRLGNRARQDNDEAAYSDLLAATALDLGDYLPFFIQRRRTIDQDQEEVAVRYLIDVQLDLRRFERVVVDVGFGTPLIATPDLVTTSSFLAFAALAPSTVQVLPLEQHVAEKIHAYSRSYGVNRLNTRTKDLVDLVLLGSMATFTAHGLKRAFCETFDARAIHPMPAALPTPPQDWINPYHVMATEIKLDPDLTTGFEQVARFINPILRGSVSDSAEWDPVHGTWIERPSGTKDTASSAYQPSQGD